LRLPQGYQHIELIISDNASTDETQAICQAAAARDSRIKFLRQPKNRGMTENFREVLRQSVGEFFMWLAMMIDWINLTSAAACKFCWSAPTTRSYA